MLASEFIKKLEKLIEEEGDLPVQYAYYGAMYNSEPFSGNKDYYESIEGCVASNVKGIFVIDEEKLC
tara:strand:- start:1125 stop:1325 length:201 start_codon:yes stop_codon:yes gene_type:complete